MWSIVDSTTRAAWFAAASQQGQLEVLAAALGSAPRKVVLGASGELSRVTMAAPTINTGTTPRRLELGQVIPSTLVNTATGTPTTEEIRSAAGTVILRGTAGISGALVNYAAGAIKARCAPSVGGTGIVVQANAALPDVDVIAWGSGTETGSISSGIWTPGRNAAGIITQASVNTLPLNQWHRVAGTQLQSLVSLVEANGFSFASDVLSVNKDIRGSFVGWVGCAHDGRTIYYPRGGGHNDSSLNGTWSMDVLKMAWAVEKMPSRPDAPGAVWATEYRASNSYTQYVGPGGVNVDSDGLYWDRLPDNEPTSAHTYNGVWYDSTRRQVGTGRVSKWTFDLASKTWTRQRWSYNGGAAQIFTINQQLFYHAAKDAVFGYPARSDFDTGTFGKVVLPGSNFVPIAGGPASFGMNNGPVGTSVRLDEDRLLFLWQNSGERWGIFNMATETWDAGSGGFITDGVTFTSESEMQIALYIPTWGTQGQVIRRGTHSATNGQWWLFDIATKANLPYTPAGVSIPVTSWPGNKWLNLPALNIALGIDDNSSLSTPAVLVMRYA